MCIQMSKLVLVCCALIRSYMYMYSTVYLERWGGWNLVEKLSFFVQPYEDKTVGAHWLVTYAWFSGCVICVFLCVCTHVSVCMCVYMHACVGLHV